MTTAERAAGIAAAARGFTDWLGPCETQDLLDLVRLELGDERMLDDFRPRGNARSRAVAPRVILHVLSGNTPHAALQTILRGLLLGSHNRCKLPAGGLIEVERFRAALPPDLGAMVECSDSLPEEWIASADAVVVFGSDDTITRFRALLWTDQIFVGHGHRVSFGVVLDDLPGSLAPAARDASLFDQRGCLSPHGFYVRGDAAGYAKLLAAEMAAFHEKHPRRSLTVDESVRIQAVRDDYRFRAANDDRYAIWMSDDGRSTNWTVIYDAECPEFIVSPLDRVIFVRPLPENLDATLAPVRDSVSAVGYWPPGESQARHVAGLAGCASRICPLGEMQFPPLAWHQDGGAVLSSLVRWVDIET